MLLKLSRKVAQIGHIDKVTLLLYKVLFNMTSNISYIFEPLMNPTLESSLTKFRYAHFINFNAVTFIASVSSNGCPPKTMFLDHTGENLRVPCTDCVVVEAPLIC